MGCKCKKKKKFANFSMFLLTKTTPPQTKIS